MLVNARSLVRAAVEAASTVVRRVTTRPTVLVLAFSKAPAVFAARKAILLLNALKSQLTFARIAVERVSIHPSSAGTLPTNYTEQGTKLLTARRTASSTETTFLMRPPRLLGPNSSKLTRNVNLTTFAQ